MRISTEENCNSDGGCVVEFTVTTNRIGRPQAAGVTLLRHW